MFDWTMMFSSGLVVFSPALLLMYAMPGKTAENAES